MKFILIILALIMVCLPKKASSFDDTFSHPKITDRALRESRIDDYLKNDFNLPDGSEAHIGDKTVAECLKTGSELEDSPLCRSSNHFHDPLQPWDVSGLTDTGILMPIYCHTGEYPASDIKSNVFWATEYKGPAPGGVHSVNDNDQDWRAAREAFYTYLTGRNGYGNLVAETQTQRNEYFAKSLQALGQVLHLLQDMAVPAHVRNDFSQGHTVPLNGGPWILFGAGNPFEGYVKRNNDDPNLFNNAISPGMDTFSLTDLWDTDRYDGTNPGIDKNLLGLAEYTQLNFASMTTVFTEGFLTDSDSGNDLFYYPFPAKSGTNLEDFTTGNLLPETVIGKDNLPVTMYAIRKFADHGGEEIAHFVKPTYLSRDLAERSVDIYNERVYLLSFMLDDDCYKDYAALLIPRAIGYSAALLDYFFRGRMQVSVLPIFNNNQLGALQIKIRNETPDETIGQGEYKLICRYQNDRMEKTAESIAWSCVDGDCGAIPSGGEATIELYFNLLGQTISIEDMRNPEAEIDCTLVFKGTLGAESDTAVIPAMLTLRNTGGTPYLDQSIQFNEEWDAGLTGTHDWIHTAPDDPDNYQNGLTVNGIIDEVLPNGLVHNYLRKQNIREGAFRTPRYNQSLLGDSSTPIRITPNTWLEFKIDEMSLANASIFEHQAMILHFNNGLKIQLTQANQGMYYSDTTATWNFSSEIDYRLNICNLLEAAPYNLLIPEPLLLEEIDFIQQIFQDTSPPGIDYIQQMKVDYIRIVEELIAVPAVTGLPSTEAEARLLDADLRLGAVSMEYSNDVPTGSVIHQDPKPGTGLPFDTEINLVVSLGPS
jgi:hypothetical protein